MQHRLIDLYASDFVTFSFCSPWLIILSVSGVVLSLLFLAISFQVENAHAPSVSRLPAFSDTCTQYSHCGDCTNDAGCGFCYLKDAKNYIANGSCVTAIEDTTAAEQGKSLSPTSLSVISTSCHCKESIPLRMLEQIRAKHLAYIPRMI